ncbi:rhodanese-like domain-containing protein [Zafaria sp. J156]|uniref:rhodanese-like domain-containing protein n=1 Tax=Zafaria sp. J156 TaxID=3116490 RepID=UPI002E788336|nr:rhodanese-like domain-containing protein [Zafaria sp. J156]MEE1621421.1 rhodanese-like domain-containing protein [Zafaria sp. J156]
MSEFETVQVTEVPAGAKVLDVREDYEWNEGHVAGAVHIPMNEIPERLEELDPDEDTYVICRTGGRSAQVAAYLTGQGYAAFNVAGGSGEWFEQGLPMASENGLEPNVR